MRPRRRSHRAVASFAALVFVAATIIPAAPALAAPCTAGQFSVTPVHSPIFYSDFGDAINGMYLGYQITNNTGSPIDDFWVSVDNFAGVVGLATNEDGIQHFGALAAGSTVYAYFYVTTTSTSNSAQTHTVNMFSGTPSPANEICDSAQSLARVVNTISANANKVTAVTNGPTPQELGGLMTITVTGDTGQVGGAGRFALTPASLLGWPANAYQLVAVTMELRDEGAPPGTGIDYNDTLFITGLANQKYSYTIVYTFVAQGTTTAPTTVAPINNINSGNPVKHTSTGTAEYQAIPPLDPPVSLLWLEKSASPTSLPTGGKAVYTVTIHNDGAVSSSLDAIVDTLPSSPATVTFDASVTPLFNGVAIPDPQISGQQLTFSGVFTTPAGGTSTLTYGVDVPNINGTYLNSAVGELGPVPVTIDSTRDDTSDNVPAGAAVTVGPLEADLGVTKTDGLSTVTAGDPATHTYTVTVTNNGPTQAENVVLTDTWPADLAQGSVTASQGSCGAGPSFSCTLGDLNPGSTATVTVDYTVPAGAIAGSVANTVTVASDTTDPGPASNTATDTNTIVKDVSWTTTKTFADADVPAGTGSYTFSIDIANGGVSDADNVSVTDTVDPALTVVSVDCDGGTNNTTGNTVDCTFLTLAGGAAASIVVTYDVPASTPVGTISNSATVQSDEAGPVSASDTVDVTENVVLDITKTFADASVTAGAGTSHTFDLVVANSGTTTADNVAIVDAVDASLTVTGTDCGAQGGTENTVGNSVDCSGLTVAPGGSFTLQVTFTVATTVDTQTVSNVAQVSSDEQATTDSNTASVNVVEGVTLVATKSFTADPIDAGSTGNTFTVAVLNSGVSDADNVLVVDTVDPAFTVTGTNCAALGGTDNTIGNNVSCALPNVVGGGTATLTVTFDVLASAGPGTISNTAQVSSDEQGATNSNTATVGVQEDVQLSAAKTFVVDPVTAGSSGNSFTVAVTNAGLSDAENVVITDTVNADLTVTGTDCSALGGSDSTVGNAVTCTLPLVTAGSTATLTVTYDVPESTDTSTISNTAQVSSDEQASTPSNTTGVSVVEDVDLTAAKLFTDPVVVAGGAASSFSVVVTNAGTSDAENVSIVDNVDPALTVTGTDCAGQGGTDGTVGNAVDCSFSSLGAGTSVTLTVDFTVDSSEAGATISNLATVASDEQAATSSNTASMDIVEDVGLQLAKAFTPSAVDGGTTGNQFTLTVTNSGTSDATGVVVTDAVDARLVVAAVDCGGGVNTSAGQDVTCTFAVLAAGASATVTVTYDVGASEESATIVNNAAVVDGDANSATASGSITISENVVLAVTKLPSPASVIAGTGGHQFSILVENIGTSDAESVNVTDTFDARLTVTGVDCGGGVDASSGQDIDCTYASLAPGGSATILVTYDVDGTVNAALIPNTALATDADANAASGLSSVEVVTVIDLDAVKQFTPATAAAGSTGNQMTLTVENNGISDANTVVVTDSVDARLSVTAVDCGGGVDSTAGQNVTCTFGTILAGASAVVTITYDISSSVAPTTIGNQFDVVDFAGNTATSLSSVNVFGSILLSASKAFGPTTAVAGSVGNQFTITVANDGLSDTSAVNITDTVDSRLQVTAVDCTGGVDGSSGQDIDCTFDPLVAGATVTVLVTYSVAETVDAATVPNVANVGDANGNFGSAFASVEISEDVDLAVTKAFIEDPVAAGTGPYSFTIAVRNSGASDADNVVVTDAVDTALTVTAVGADMGGTCDPPSNAISCTIPVLAAGATATVTVTYDAAGGPSATVSNTAEVTSDETLLIGTSTDTVDVVNPSVSMNKTADATTVNPGDPVTYTYVVTNDGDVHVSNVSIVDDAGTPAVPGDDVTLACDSGSWPVAPGDSVTCAITVSVTVDTTNVAVVTANPVDAGGTDIPTLANVTDTDTESVNVLITGLSISKSTLTPVVTTGGTASYRYNVENTGDEPLFSVSVIDDRCPTPVFDSEQSGNGDAIFDGGEIWRFTCDVTVTGDVTNTAFASALDELGQSVVSATDTASVDVIDPALDLRKTADATQVTPGTSITYTIEVENVGDDPLVNVVVTDDTCSGLTLVSGDGGALGVLEVGETWIFDCSTVAGTNDVANVASVTADDSLGQQVTASDSVTVLVNLPPVAGDDSAETNQDTAVTIDLLVNDSDSDGTLDPGSVTITNGPSDGSVVIDPATGEATYTPDPGFFGTDTFDYEVCDDDGACAMATVTVTVNGAPVTAPDSGLTNEATPINLDVLDNDTDPEGDPLTVTGFPTPPINGTAVIEPDGTVTYTPDAGFTGTEVFTYEVCDDGGACSVETVSVDINSTPVAVDDTAGTLANTAVVIDVLANDTDADGNIDPTSVSILALPNTGTVAVDPVTGAVTYTPDPGFIGDDTFVYQVCDDLGACDSAVVTVTVSAFNTPPVAVDDAAVTDVDVPVTVDVLANDTDAESNIDPTSVSVVFGPFDGTVSVDAVTGEITYTPDPGFSGNDQITYEVCDLAGECDTAVLDVLVNEPPIVNDDADATNQEQAVTVDVLLNDSDADGVLDPASVTVTSGPTNGTVSVDPVTGEITYAPDPGFFGADTFTYEVCDDAGSCGSATVTIDVNGAPQTAPDTATTNSGALVAIDVLANDTDPELDPMTVTDIPAAPTFGTAVINGGTGEVDYTPDPGFYGTDTFTYEVCDSLGACSIETVTVTVDGPPTAVDDGATTDVDIPVSIDVLANDTDPEGALDPSSVNVTTGPTNGSTTVDLVTGAITYSPDPGFVGADVFTYEVCDGATPPQCDIATVTVGVDDPVLNDPPVAVDDSDVTQIDASVTTAVLDNDLDPESGILTVNSVSNVTAGATVVINGDNTITYTPPSGFTGVDTYTYEVCDDGAPLACDTATVTITVNDPPVAADDGAATDEGVAVTIPVLANDSDGDGFLVPSSVTIVGLPSDGTVTVDPNTGDITYAPDPGFFGTDSFMYEVCDDLGGCATATVTVDVNALPVVPGTLAVTSDGSPVIIDVVAAATDPDGSIDPTSVSVVMPPANGAVAVDPVTGQITYTPDPGFSGIDVFTYEICDDDGGCSIGTIEVTVNGPPIAVDDTAATNQGLPVTIAVTANDSDPDGLDLAAVSVTTQPANGTATANPDGTVTYLPDPGFFGTDAFTYEVCDLLGACSLASVVVDVNGAPLAIPDAGTVDEGSSINIDVLANDSDPEADPLTVVGFPVAPSNGTVVIEADGTITYTPNPGFIGTDSFTYEVCDDQGACSEASISVTTNGLPIAVNDAAVTSPETPVDIDVLLNDIDPESALDPATVMVISGPSNGSVTVDAMTGVVTYSPDQGFFGTDTFVYEVCDDAGACSSATVSVEVGNPPPLGAPDFAVTNEDTAVTINVLANDSDPTGEALFIGAVTQPANGMVVVNVEGTITYTPDPEFSGEDTFTYEACDFDPGSPGGGGGQSCDIVSVTVTVLPINDPPTIVTANPITIGVGEPIPPLLAFDPDGTTFTFSLVGGALPPGVTLNPDGSFSGTSNVLGNFTFTVQVCDAGDPPSCSTVTFTLIVQALPTTGTAVFWWALIAVLLAMAGAGLVMTERLTERRA